jgi:diaminopimelate epimerase
MTKKKIPFELMHGAGNIFIVINNDELNLSLDELSEFMTKEYPLHFPVDGLMAYKSSEVIEYEFTIEFLNPDGSHGAMCGNGARCAIKYHIKQLEDNFEEFPITDYYVSFKMAGTIYRGFYLNFGDYISVIFPNEPIAKEVELETENGFVYGIHVFNGSDHLIIDSMQFHIHSNDFFRFDFKSLAEPLRHHPSFPNGANVNLAMPLRGNQINLRTFERGVERETAACGTGALATAYAYCECVKSTYLVAFPRGYPVELIVQSGDILNVERRENSNELTLIGPAEFLTIDEAFEMHTQFQQRIQ